MSTVLTVPTVGWIGVDLDGTLAEYHGWNGGEIGAPIPAMVDRVKSWLAAGEEVRIFTARAAECGPQGIADRAAIKDWCVKHVGRALSITCQKDFAMIELWDDRCVCVEKNTGKILGRNVE